MEGMQPLRPICRSRACGTSRRSLSAPWPLLWPAAARLCRLLRLLRPLPQSLTAAEGCRRPAPQTGERAMTTSLRPSAHVKCERYLTYIWKPKMCGCLRTAAICITIVCTRGAAFISSCARVLSPYEYAMCDRCGAVGTAAAVEPVLGHFRCWATALQWLAEAAATIRQESKQGAPASTAIYGMSLPGPSSWRRWSMLLHASSEQETTTAFTSMIVSPTLWTCESLCELRCGATADQSASKEALTDQLRQSGYQVALLEPRRSHEPQPQPWLASSQPSRCFWQTWASACARCTGRLAARASWAPTPATPPS